jgi:ribosomal protein L29
MGETKRKDAATEAIDSPMRFRALRREIARIQTVLREKKG